MNMSLEEQERELLPEQAAAAYEISSLKLRLRRFNLFCRSWRSCSCCAVLNCVSQRYCRIPRTQHEPANNGQDSGEAEQERDLGRLPWRSIADCFAGAGTHDRDA